MENGDFTSTRMGEKRSAKEVRLRRRLKNASLPDQSNNRATIATHTEQGVRACGGRCAGRTGGKGKVKTRCERAVKGRAILRRARGKRTGGEARVQRKEGTKEGKEEDEEKNSRLLERDAERGGGTAEGRLAGGRGVTGRRERTAVEQDRKEPWICRTSTQKERKEGRKKGKERRKRTRGC
jgi:hypothetical protein